MKKSLFVVFALISQMGYAQTIKTGVLVIGNGNNAIGAGFQSAKSGAKTIVLSQGADFDLSRKANLNKNLASGIEGEFLSRMRKAKGIKDNAEVYVDHTSANAILKVWADSTKNLQIIGRKGWLKLKRSGKGWSVQLSDGKVIKAAVLVNADHTGKVNEALQLPEMSVLQWKTLAYTSNLYRTSVASGYDNGQGTANVISLYDLLVQGQDNLVVLNPDQESMAGGQAAGATAAYAAFFKTKTSKSNLKAIQGELVGHKSALIPFVDVMPVDSSWKAVQFTTLSGFLKAELSEGTTRFLPDQAVSAAEIKLPVKEHYYKAQIWFDDYKAVQMTIASTLDLVSRVGNKSPENTREEVKKKWKTTYRFQTEFEPDRVITRREFAVLVNEYLKPFDVNIDAAGRVIR